MRCFLYAVDLELFHNLTGRGVENTVALDDEETVAEDLCTLYFVPLYFVNALSGFGGFDHEIIPHVLFFAIA